MIAFLKAVPFGLALTILVALFIGSGGGHGGMLAVREVEVMEVEFYWSWNLFVGGTLLTWILLLMIDD